MLLLAHGFSFEKNQVYTLDYLKVIIDAITEEAILSLKPYEISFLKRQGDGNRKHYVIMSDIMLSTILLMLSDC